MGATYIARGQSVEPIANPYKGFVHYVQQKSALQQYVPYSRNTNIFVGAISPAYQQLAESYYQQHFGYFCKQEWEWQKQTSIPLRMRLGSLEYTDRKEGKY